MQCKVRAPQVDLGRRRLTQGALALALPGIGSAAPRPDDSWPSRPVRLIVSFPAGTSADFLARVFSDPLSRALGQPLIVENKAGATGSIGVDFVARATDGHTLGLTGNGSLTTAKALNPKTPFDVTRDLRPVSLLGSTPFVLTGSMTLPQGDLNSIVSWARTQGDKLSYGSIGIGSASHLGMELLKEMTGIKPVHVPFQGFPQVATAMAAGQVELAFMAPSVAMPIAANKRLRILGVGTAVRSPLIPEAPAIAQALQLPKFEVVGWNAIFGPASLPEVRANWIADEIGKIARTPEVRQRLLDQGWEAIGSSPEGLSRRIAEDTALWGGVIRSTNTHVE